MTETEVLLANPRGFCAGVERAIGIVERALELYGAPIYVRHEVVHNRFVVENLRSKGAIFIEDLAKVPEGSILIFSAHGVSKAVREEAEKRGLKVFDATCPLAAAARIGALDEHLHRTADFQCRRQRLGGGRSERGALRFRM